MKGRPLNFEAANLGQPYKQWMDRTYTFKSVSDVAKVYSANISRCIVIAMVPGGAFFEGGKWQEALAEAMNELKIFDEDDNAVCERASRIFSKKRYERTDVKENSKRVLEATRNTEETWSHSKHFHGALHHILQLMVIQAWTAFEVMTDHLWRAATRERPSLLAKLSNTQRGKLGFRSRKKIRESYKMTFTVDGDPIQKLLSSQTVDELALIRCVLVHSAGNVDQWFIDDSFGVTTPMATHYRALGIGAEIQLKGDETRRLIDPVSKIGYDLLRAVDNWLLLHP